MTTDISICSSALVLLGDDPIASFSEDTDAARIAATRYPTLRDRIIGSHPWRCMMTKKELTRDAAGPIGEWRNSYIIPGEASSASAQAAFSSPGVDELPAKSWEIFGQRIYSNYERMLADFVVIKTENEWPGWFADLMMYCFMADVAFAVTDSQSTADRWVSFAYGSPSEEGKGGYFGQCLTINAQGQPNEFLQNDAFINARAGGWGGY